MVHYWFINTKYAFSRRFALLVFLFTFLVIQLGAYTRLTNAGLSCPDWPHCYGYMTVPHTEIQIKQAAQFFPSTPLNFKKAWTEMSHRYAAGIVGLLIIALALTVFMSRKSYQDTMIALSLLLLLSVQVLLGMLTVTEKLKPIIVLSHLLTGVSILCFLWLLFLNLNSAYSLYNYSPLKMNISPWYELAFAFIFIQIALGGWVSTHYAGLACIDFPYCNGQLIPPLKWHQFNIDLITIHMVHRIWAFITACYLGFLALVSMGNRLIRPFAIGTIFLLGCQVALGVLNIVWLRPVWIAMLHQLGAILLLLTVITIIVKFSSFRKKNASFIA